MINKRTYKLNSEWTDERTNERTNKHINDKTIRAEERTEAWDVVRSLKSILFFCSQAAMYVLDVLT